MHYRKISTALLSAAGIFLLIMDGKTAIDGISEGISICIQSVIPALFPFFVLGSLLTGTLLGTRISILHPLGQMFRIPKGAESLLLIGLLGGYPTGAQTVAQAYRSGQISRKAAERMVVFCNQSGPSFLFGILGTILSHKKACLLWIIQIISALLVSLCIPAPPEEVIIHPKEPINLPSALNNGIRIMAAVCGWVVLFRMIIAFANRWIFCFLPGPWKIVITGILELTNGCLSLSQVQNESIQFLICSGILGFGGICVTMQTVSVTEGLRLQLYFPGKLLQAVISMLLSWILFPSDITVPAVLMPIILICVFSLGKMEKKSRNRLAIGV